MIFLNRFSLFVNKYIYYKIILNIIALNNLLCAARSSNVYCGVIKEGILGVGPYPLEQLGTRP